MEQTPSEKGTKAAAGALSALPRGAASPAAQPLSRPLPAAAARISQRGLGGAASLGLGGPAPHSGERGARVSRPPPHPADARVEEGAGLVGAQQSSGKPGLITQAGRDSGPRRPTTSGHPGGDGARSEAEIGRESSRLKPAPRVHPPSCPPAPAAPSSRPASAKSLLQKHSRAQFALLQFQGPPEGPEDLTA